MKVTGRRKWTCLEHLSLPFLECGVQRLNLDSFPWEYVERGDLQERDGQVSEILEIKK